MAARNMIRRWYSVPIAVLLAGCALVTGCVTASSSSGPARPVSASQPGTLVLAGLRPVSGPTARSYLGSVGGTGALIGVVVTGIGARAYLCDGIPGRVVSLADWFAGPVRGGILTAVSSQHRVRLTIRLGQRGAVGTVNLANGAVYRFTAAAAATGSLRAGVFAGTGRLNGLSYHAGRIVLPDGDQRGAYAYPTGPTKRRAISYYPLGLVV